MSDTAFRSNRYTSKSLIRCDQCKRVAHHTYKVNFGGFLYNFCSGECTEVSRQNFEKNKNIVFVDSTPKSPDYLPEMDE